MPKEELEMTDTKVVKTEMTIIRAGNEIEVEIDGMVYFEECTFSPEETGSRTITEVCVTGVEDIDAVYDNMDDPAIIVSVELTEAEKKQAEQLLTDKFREGV